MREDDFYIEDDFSTDAFGGTPTRVLDTDRLEAIARGPIQEYPDIEVAVALARLAHDEYEMYGTSGSSLNNEQSALLMRTLKRLLSRLGIDSFDPQFRDFDSFRRHWNRNGAHGTWQGRRDMLNDLFEPLHGLLDRKEADAMEWKLAEAISPHPVLGWPRVDAEIAEMRRHFNTASTQQDYSNIGNDCVAVLEALSAVVYVHDRHGLPGADEPPVPSTKVRFDRYIEVELQGSEHSELRKIARASIEMAQAVKHRRETATRREAGIAADSVILLSNIFRRLQG